MTKVIIKESNEFIQSLEVFDHAYYNDENDVVCAGISTILFGGLNALIEMGLDENDIEFADAYIKINLNHDDVLQIVVKTMIIQLQTIAQQYNQYITINAV